ncbi:MAG: thymidine kinase [Cytophagales bacterium]
MLKEPAFGLQNGGWIEVICGCMFSGKTEELIRRIDQAKLANQSIIVFKPVFDTRYHQLNVVSHNAMWLEATPVRNAREILSLALNADVVGIDEAQFFDQEIVEICNQLANVGKRVIVVGLDMDYAGRPFGPMPNLMAIAEFVTKLHAICAKSGEMASYSFRKSTTKDEKVLGEKELYEPRSRNFFYD